MASQKRQPLGMEQYTKKDGYAMRVDCWFTVGSGSPADVHLGLHDTVRKKMASEQDENPTVGTRPILAGKSKP